MNFAEAVQHTILSVPSLPYGEAAQGAEDGCPTDMLWHESLLMRAGSPPKVNCSGMTAWCFFEILTHLGLDDGISISDAKRLRKYFSIIDWETHPERLKGGPQGLVDLGLGVWVPLEEARLGDVIHIQWDPAADPTDGHAMIVTEYQADFNGGPAIWGFSANTTVPKYDPPYEWASWHLSKAAGSQHDYFRVLSHPERKFWVARPTIP